MFKNSKILKLIALPIILLFVFVGGFWHFKIKQAQTISNEGVNNLSPGVLALNTDKSDYVLGEKMTVNMASLDQTGHTLCNSNLKLEITNPKNKTEELSITNSPTCGNDNVTSDPDYFSSLTLNDKGQYKLKLTNLDSKQTVETDIQVSESLPFDIKRSGATRINPFKFDRYPMIITVKANQDYAGQIIEEIPANFKIVWQGPAKVEGTKIIWEVNLKAGETKTLSYKYQAPKVSPEFYLLGPININNIIINSSWQIAADAITIIQSAKYQPAATGNTVVLILGSTPTVGNILVAFTAYSQYSEARTLTAPDGTWTKVDDATYSYDSLSDWWHEVEEGDGTTYTFNITGTNEWRSGVIYELSGVDTTTPINQHSIVTDGSVSSIATTGITPSVLNTKALAAANTDTGGSYTSTVSSGWTLDQSAVPSYHSTFAASRDALTSDTTTSITNTFSFSGSSNGTVAAAVLLAPATNDSFTGIAYTDEGSTPDTSASICAVVNNGTPACDSTDGSGEFVINTLNADAGDQLTFFFDGGTEFGNTVTVSDGGNIESGDNLKVFQGHVIVRYEQGSNITILQMDAYDSDQNDTDMLFDAEDDNPDTLVVEDGNELYVPSGFTFAPGGNVTVDDIEVVGTYTEASATLTISGTFTLSGTFTASSGTVNYDDTSGQTVAATSYNNLTLSVSGAKSMSGITTIGGDLTISGSATMTSNSAFTLSGTLTYSSSGSTTLTSSTAINIGAMNQSAGTINDNGNTITVTGSSTPWTKSGGTFTTSGTTIFNANATIATLLSGTVNFNNLTFSPTLTSDRAYTFGVSPTIAGDFTVNPSGAYRLTVNLSDDLVVTGTTNLTGTGSGVSTLDTASGSNYALTTAILTIGSAGTLTANNSTITINGTSATIFSQSGTFTPGGSTFVISGSGAISLTAATTFNNLTITGTPTTSNDFTINGALVVSGSGNLSPSGGTVSMDTTDWTIANSATLVFSGLTIAETPSSQSNTSYSVAGALTVNSGKTLAPSGGTITMTGGSIVNNGGASSNLVFNNLTITGTTSTSSDFTVNGTLNVSGGNLSPSGGTITMATTSWGITNSGTLVFSSLTISETPSVSGQPTSSFSVSGALTVNGGKDLSPTAGTITMTGGSIVNSGTLNFYNLTVSGSTSSNSTFGVSNDLVVNGTLSGSAGATINGAFTGTGTVNMSGGTVEQRVGADENFGGTGGNTWNFSTLRFSNSDGSNPHTITTQSDAGGITASTLLQIGKAGDGQATTLDANNRTWTLSGTNGTPFDIIGSSSLTASTSTFSYTGANGSGDTTLQNATYYNLTVNASDTFVLEASPLNINNDLTVTTGTLSLSSNSLNVGSTGVTDSGDIAVAGSLTQSSSGTTTVKTSGSGSATVGGAGTLTFYNLTLAPDANGATIYLGSDVSQAITVSNDLTVGNGTNTVIVNADSNDPNLDINGSFTISANGTFQASSGGDFQIAKNFTNNNSFVHNSGTITFDSANEATLLYSGATTFNNFNVSTGGKQMKFDNVDQTNVAGNLNLQGTNCTTGRIFLDPDTPSQVWEINATSGVDIDYVDVEYSNAITPLTTAYSTQDNNHNTNWTFTDSGCAISLSGTAYSNEGGSPLGSNLTVNLRIDGDGSYTDETSSGAWEIGGLNLSSSQIVTVYLDEETPEATTVIVSDGTDQTNVHLYQNTVIVRADTSSISNANMDTGDDGDDNIKYQVSSNNLLVDSGFELHVWDGDTYDPNGTVTTQGGADFHLDDDAVAYLDSATSTIADDIAVDTGAILYINEDTIVAGGGINAVGTVTTSAGTPTTTIRGTGNIGGGGTILFHNLTIGDGTTASTTLTSAVSTNADVAIGNGSSLELGSQNLIVGGGDLTTTGTGSLTCSGCSGGTTTINGSGVTGIGGGSGEITFYNLTIGGTVPVASTINVSNDLTVTGNLAVGANNLGVGSTGVTDSGDIAVAGSLTQSSSGTTTVKTSAAGQAIIGGAGTLTFYNLTLAPDADGGTIYLGSGASQSITIANDLTIGNGTNTVIVNADSNDPTLDINGSLSIAVNGTFQASQTSSFQIAKNFTNNGTFTHNSGTVTFDTTNTSIFNGSGTPAITFYNFSSTTGGKTLQFTEGITFKIEGLLTLTGDSENEITINSTTSTQWLVDHQGTESVTYCTVQNSGCAVGTTDVSLDATNNDAGNNGPCWLAIIGVRVKGSTRIKGGVRIK